MYICIVHKGTDHRFRFVIFVSLFFQMERLKEENQRLQIECDFMAREVDLYTNGNSKFYTVCKCKVYECCIRSWELYKMFVKRKCKMLIIQLHLVYFSESISSAG